MGHWQELRGKPPKSEHPPGMALPCAMWGGEAPVCRAVGWVTVMLNWWQRTRHAVPVGEVWIMLENGSEKVVFYNEKPQLINLRNFYKVFSLKAEK